MTLFLSFALSLLLFIAFPSCMWNFDGVACAAALELGRPLFLFHSNHLFYGFLGFLFWKGMSVITTLRALPALQLFTSLLTAAGLSGLYAVLRRLLGNERLALLLLWGVSATAVVWVWSVEAQVYALGFLALSWATCSILKPDHPQKWIRVGALHAGAVLGHIVHVLWIVPALYWLWKEPRRNRARSLPRYLATLSTLVLIPYALVIGILVAPKHWDDRWLFKWLMGSAALNPTSVFEWHHSGLSGPFQWAAATPRLFWGSFWPYQTSVPAWSWVLTALSGATVVTLLCLSFKNRRTPVWMFCALWLAVYAVFFSTWEPMMECYRMTDLIPLSILLTLGLKAIGDKRLAWALAGVWVATLLPVNGVTRIYPMHDLQRNALYQETLALAKATPENSLYLTAGRAPWMYLLYFSGRSAWDLHSFQRVPKRLGDELGRHLANQPVYIRADALDMDLIHPWLARRRTRPLGHALPWLQIQ